MSPKLKHSILNIQISKSHTSGVSQDPECDKQFVLKIRETKLVVDYTFFVVLLCCLSVFLMLSRVI